MNTQAKDPYSSAEKIGGNILSLGSGEIVARAIAFLGTAYVARTLGPLQFGIIGFAAALFGYLSLSVTSDFGDVGSREVARRPHEASSIAANVIAVKLIVAVFALAALIATALLLNKPTTVKIVLSLMGLLFFSLAVNVSWVYKGLEQNRPIAISLILSQLLYTALVFLAVNGPEDAVVVPVAQFAGEISAALILLFPLFRLGAIKLDLREGFRIFRHSSFWAVSRLLRTLLFTFDIVLIGFLIGEQAVGIYSAPYRICFLLVALAVAVHSSYLPTFVRAFHSDLPLNETGKAAGRSLLLAVTVAAPLIVGGIIVSEPLLVFIFGSEYAGGADAFKFLLVGIGFLFLHGANHNVFLAANRLKTELMVFAAAAAVNIGLNIAVIPRYGIDGAAFATALAEAVTLVLGWFFVRKMGISLGLVAVWRPLLASMLMGAALLALGENHSLFLYLAAGGIVYLTALTLLRGFPLEFQPFLRIINTSFNNLLKGIRAK